MTQFKICLFGVGFLLSTASLWSSVRNKTQKGRISAWLLPVMFLALLFKNVQQLLEE